MSNKLKSQEKANRISEIDDHIRRNFEIIKVKNWRKENFSMNTSLALFIGIRTFFGLNFNRNHIIRCMTLNVFGLSLFCVANHSVIWSSWMKIDSHAESAPNKFLMTNGEQQKISMQMASEKASFWYTKVNANMENPLLTLFHYSKTLAFNMTILWVPQSKPTIDLFVVRLCFGNLHNTAKNGIIKWTLLHNQSRNDCHFNLTLDFPFLFYSSRTCWVRAKDTSFFQMSSHAKGQFHTIWSHIMHFHSSYENHNKMTNVYRQRYFMCVINVRTEQKSNRKWHQTECGLMERHWTKKKRVYKLKIGSWGHNHRRSHLDIWIIHFKERIKAKIFIIIIKENSTFSISNVGSNFSFFTFLVCVTYTLCQPNSLCVCRSTNKLSMSPIHFFIENH